MRVDARAKGTPGGREGGSPLELEGGSEGREGQGVKGARGKRKDGNLGLPCENSKVTMNMSPA